MEEHLLAELLVWVVEPLLLGIARVLAATLPSRWRESPWLAGVGYLLFGLLSGGLSVWLVPHHFLKSSMLRAANFVAAPILCGFTLSMVGVWRRRRHGTPSLVDGFRYGMLFGITVQIVRALAIP